jgi:hypothetical protein
MDRVAANCFLQAQGRYPYAQMLGIFEIDGTKDQVGPIQDSIISNWRITILMNYLIATIE